MNEAAVVAATKTDRQSDGQTQTIRLVDWHLTGESLVFDSNLSSTLNSSYPKNRQQATGYT